MYVDHMMHTWVNRSFTSGNGGAREDCALSPYVSAEIGTMGTRVLAHQSVVTRHTIHGVLHNRYNFAMGGLPRCTGSQSMQCSGGFCDDRWTRTSY